jgi:hypothetical protein
MCLVINKYTGEDAIIMKGEKALISLIIQKETMNILPRMILETEVVIIIKKKDSTKKDIRGIISRVTLIEEPKDRIWLRRHSIGTLNRETDWRF